MRVGVKDAVAKAIEYVQELFGSSDRGFSLEEVEISEDGKFWLVTIGFSRRVANVSPIDALRVPQYERQYKVVKVDGTSGEPLSVKMRLT